jgi:hypothetical protein
MMPVNSSDIEIQNEKEWRRYQIKKLDELNARLGNIERRMTSLEILGATLKVKVGMVSAFFGAISSALVSFFINKTH